MWRFDLCSSFAFLLASGFAVVATCAALVALAHKHCYIQIWPVPLSLAGSTYPCRLVSRIGFGSAAFFMILWPPRISQAFVGSLLDNCESFEECLTVNLLFCFLAWTSALGCFVQGSIFILNEGTHAESEIPLNMTHKMHFTGVTVMFSAVFALYVFAIMMTLIAGNPRAALLIFMPPLVVAFLTLSCLMLFQGTVQALPEDEARIARWRAGGRLQWTSIAAVVSVFGALSLQAVSVHRMDLQVCSANGTYLIGSCGVPFALFVGAVAYGCRHGTREVRAGGVALEDGAAGGPLVVRNLQAPGLTRGRTTPALPSASVQPLARRSYTEGNVRIVKEKTTLTIEALRDALLIPKRVGGEGAQPLLL